jgi:hypothetical protein
MIDAYLLRRRDVVPSLLSRMGYLIEILFKMGANLSMEKVTFTTVYKLFQLIDDKRPRSGPYRLYRFGCQSANITNFRRFTLRT